MSYLFIREIQNHKDYKILSKFRFIFPIDSIYFQLTVYFKAYIFKFNYEHEYTHGDRSLAIPALAYFIVCT